MDWKKLKSLADVIGAMAVILTLVYMIIEIKQNTAALKVSTAQADLDSSIQTLSIAIDQPEIWLSRVQPDLTEE